MPGYSDLRKGRWSAPAQVYHVITTTAGRARLFTDLRCARVAINALRAEHDHGKLNSLAFVLMPDHLHWLFSLSGSHDLSECVRSFKTHSARRINCLLGRFGPVWQKGFYDRGIRREEDLTSVARYILANPIRAEIVSSAREYPHWDAFWV